MSASVGEPTGIVLAVAVARSPGLRVVESLTVEVDGRTVEMRELEGRAGTRWHRATVPAGELEVRYGAEVEGRATPAVVVEREGIHCDYVRGGTVVYARSDAQWADARSQVAEAREFGVDFMQSSVTEPAMDVIAAAAARISCRPAPSSEER